MNFGRACRLYIKFIIQYIKMLMQSKLDFGMGVVGFIFNQLFGIVFLSLVYQEINTLAGWNFNQLLFVYGFFQIPKGLDHLFTDNLWMVAWFQIRNGKFDKYLLRPANILFQIISEKIQFDGFGEIILGIIIVHKAIKSENILFDGKKSVFLIVSIIMATIIFTSIKVIITASAFWLKESGELLETVYQVADFSKYPVSIYPRLVRNIITYVLPFAWVTYYPACYLLNKGVEYHIIIMQMLVALVMVMVAMIVFNRGVYRYESAGN